MKMSNKFCITNSLHVVLLEIHERWKNAGKQTNLILICHANLSKTLQKEHWKVRLAAGNFVRKPCLRDNFSISTLFRLK